MKIDEKYFFASYNPIKVCDHIVNVDIIVTFLSHYFRDNDIYISPLSMMIKSSFLLL